MALVLGDRVRDVTTTTGTGTVTLSGTAPTGYRSFASGVGNGNTTYYTIVAGAEWEVGLGTFTSSGNTLSRDVVYSSSNSNNLVNFSAGTKDVFVTYPAAKSIADGYGTLPVANGGTGATTLSANSVLLGNGTSAVQTIAPGASGNVLTSDGTTWTSAATTPSGVLPDPREVLSSTTFSAFTSANGVFGVVEVSATQRLFLCWEGGSADIYGIAHDGTSYSAPVLLSTRMPTTSTANWYRVRTVKVSNGLIILAVSVVGTYTTYFRAISMSGTTVTVGAEQSVSLDCGGLTGLTGAAFGSSVLFIGNDSAGTLFGVAMTVSGTTLTVGSSVALTGTGQNDNAIGYLSPYSASSGFFISSSSGANDTKIRGFTISGTTLTLGSESTITGQFYNNALVRNSSGAYIGYFSGQGGLTPLGVRITMSGATATVTTAAFPSAINTPQPFPALWTASDEGIIVYTNNYYVLSVADDNIGVLTVDLFATGSANVYSTAALNGKLYIDTAETPLTAYLTAATLNIVKRPFVVNTNAELIDGMSCDNLGYSSSYIGSSISKSATSVINIYVDTLSTFLNNEEFVPFQAKFYVAYLNALVDPVDSSIAWHFNYNYPNTDLTVTKVRLP